MSDVLRPDQEREATKPKIVREWRDSAATNTDSAKAAQGAVAAGATTAGELLAATQQPPVPTALEDLGGQAAFASPVPPTALQAKGGQDLFAGGKVAGQGDRAVFLDQNPPLAPDPSSAPKTSAARQQGVRTGIVGSGEPGAMRLIKTARQK